MSLGAKNFASIKMTRLWLSIFSHFFSPHCVLIGSLFVGNIFSFFTFFYNNLSSKIMIYLRHIRVMNINSFPFLASFTFWISHIFSVRREIKLVLCEKFQLQASLNIAVHRSLSSQEMWNEIFEVYHKSVADTKTILHC